MNAHQRRVRRREMKNWFIGYIRGLRARIMEREDD